MTARLPSDSSSLTYCKMEKKSQEKGYIVYSSLNYAGRVRPPSKKRMPSMTIPNQSLTLAQLLDRHTRGMSLGAIAKEPLFEDEEFPSSGINPKTLDLADIEAMSLQNSQKIKTLNYDVEKNARSKADAERQKAIDEEVEKRLQAANLQSSNK